MSYKSTWSDGFTLQGFAATTPSEALDGILKLVVDASQTIEPLKERALVRSLLALLRRYKKSRYFWHVCRLLH
jgi:hypothetical protein